jgi:hypothetical protein
MIWKIETLIKNRSLLRQFQKQLLILPCWSLTENSSSFDFTDLVKGLIPNDMVLLIQKCGLTNGEVTTIITQTMNVLHLEIRHTWLSRCDLVTTKEKSLGISHKMKRSKTSRNINPNNLTFPLISFNSNVNQNCILDESHKIWFRYACRYGNSWKDF